MFRYFEFLEVLRDNRIRQVPIVSCACMIRRHVIFIMVTLLKVDVDKTFKRIERNSQHV